MDIIFLALRTYSDLSPHVISEINPSFLFFKFVLFLLMGYCVFIGRTCSMVAKNVEKWRDSFCQRFDIEVRREENIGYLVRGDYAKECVYNFISRFSLLFSSNMYIVHVILYLITI